MYRASCFALLLVHSLAIELQIQQLNVANIDLAVGSQRTITLSPGQNYVLGCSPIQSVQWSSQLIGDKPSDNTTSAVFYKSSSETYRLVIQNFSKTLSGNYTCSGLGETKTVTILLGNPAVLTSAQQLFFILGSTPKADEKQQEYLVSGVPSPTLNDIQWFLNDTIPVSTLPGFSGDEFALSLPSTVTYDVSGRYTVVVNTSAGVARDSFTVSVGIQPFPVVSPDRGQAVLGNKLTLVCTDSQALPPPNFTWSRCVSRNVNCTPLQNGAGTTAYMSPSSNTTVLTVDPVRLTDGGVYRCEAKNNYGLSIREAEVTLSLPQPLSVDLSIATPAPYLAGRGIQLTCTATLANAGISFDSITAQFVWKRGDEIIDTSNSRISITDLVSAGNTRSQQLSIDPLSYSSDSHDGYTCEVILAVRNTDITSYPMASHTVPVNVQVPQTSIDISPERVEALDVVPYNDFSLSCSFANPRNITLEYAWFSSDGQLQHGHNGVSITETAQNGSVIRIVTSTAASYSVFCRVRGHLLGEELFMVKHSSSITIRGPTVPQAPTDVGEANISYNHAVIVMTVPRISYTPEQYYVQYGTSSNLLQYRSEVRSGNTDISTVNERITVTLNNLRHNTQYYYRAFAQNNVGTVHSNVYSFQTERLVLLQVRAGPFQGCEDNKVQQSTAVNEFFRATLVNAINSRCFCDFPITNLINGTVLCPGDDSQDLVYRGYIVRLDHLTSDQLLTYVDAWVRSGPYIASGVAAILFNPNCTISVPAMNETVCPSSETSLSGSPVFTTANVVVLVTIVVIAILLILIIVILVLVCVTVSQHKQIHSLRKRKKMMQSLTRQDSCRSGSGSSSGTSGVAAVMPVTTVSGFAEKQGVNWGKGTSVTVCPDYCMTYIPIDAADQEHSNVRHDSESSHTESVPCIYDTVPKNPRGMQYGGAVNPRLALSITDEDQTDDDDITECDTVVD